MHPRTYAHIQTQANTHTRTHTACYLSGNICHSAGSSSRLAQGANLHWSSNYCPPLASEWGVWCVNGHNLTHRSGYNELQALFMKVMAGDHESSAWSSRPWWMTYTHTAWGLLIVVDFSQDPRPDPSGCVRCCVRVSPPIRGHGGHTHTLPTTPLYIF